MTKKYTAAEMAPKHPKTVSCSDYLPKPRKWRSGLIAQCSYCKTLFVCRWRGYGAWWTELNEWH